MKDTVNKNKIRCAGYVRDTSWEKGCGLSGVEQASGIRSFVDGKPEWEFVEIFKDHGGLHEKLSTMVKHRLEGQFDCIIFQSIYFTAGNFPGTDAENRGHALTGRHTFLRD